MVSNVLIGLAEYAPIITIESLDNLITKSNIDRTQQSAVATRLYSSSIVVSFSASIYPQFEIDDSLSGIHNTFEPSLIHTYVIFIVIINSLHNNLLEINPMIHTRLISGMEQTYFLIEYPWNKCTFSVLGLY